ncbi:hypothetical protein [Nonomuraea endophytica]|uniref:hypothetical protein n=1 Tax=Nonomuraea endophytica TaxID=714136 RepID=UPI0037CB886D
MAPATPGQGRVNEVFGTPMAGHGRFSSTREARNLGEFHQRVRAFDEAEFGVEGTLRWGQVADRNGNAVPANLSSSRASGEC